MLYCVLIESPEVLNIIQENHIKSIISLLDKHGRNHKVCSMSLEKKHFVSLRGIKVQGSTRSFLAVFRCPGLGCALLSMRVQRCGRKVKPEPDYGESAPWS